MAFDLKNALELKGGMNGLKSIMGATLIVTSAQLHAFQEIASAFPDVGAIGEAVTYLGLAAGFLATPVSVVGVLSLASGLGHKLIKLFSK